MTASRHKAERTCLGCRETFDPQQLVRYVVSPQGEVLVDYRKRLPGRGAYTCLKRQCIDDAVKRRQFGRAFRGLAGDVSAEVLTESLVAEVRSRILSLIGMARKSGCLVSGSNLVMMALSSPDSFTLIILSADISTGIGDKIKSKARHLGVPCFTFSTKEDLGHLLGKEERSVVGIKPGGLANSIIEELSRYKHIAGEF
ncbi:YlxR family protein [Desulfuromonas sp. AOP6]|uniref:DUF448 domain-containing protein n=1 Tax=Desulfuromonas sp. AOP6 TaxID=1566351 RepID=UPI001274C5ED|nr:YlxR family protein [Desulfuromonas sp. AOP6]BCA79517.1 50S ribosomal protein L7L12 [Desulfuromonas sp. AOP6]